MSLVGKTVLITGASRGIGLSIAKRLAREGPNLVLASKTMEPHPKLTGTLKTAIDEIRKTTGTHPATRYFAHQLDLRNPEQAQATVEAAVKKFGGVDILVNNASALEKTQNTCDLALKKYNLLNEINTRGTFLITQAALPHLVKSEGGGRVLTMSPPINLNPKWFTLGGTAYTVSKYSMTLYTMGWAEEFRGRVACNTLWPRYTIGTAAVGRMLGQKGLKHSLPPEFTAEAAAKILQYDVNETGNCYIDTEVLLVEMMMGEIPNYVNDAEKPLLPDLYVGDPNEVEQMMNNSALKMSAVTQAGKNMIKGWFL